MRIEIIAGEYCVFYGPYESHQKKKRRKEKARKRRRALELCYFQLTPVFDTEYSICESAVKTREIIRNNQE